jgi:hypothetical protein
VDKREFNLLGKDYLTTEEAAFYACISPSQFKKYRKEHRLLPISHMGKLVYRKADIQRSIEEAAEWQHSTEIKHPGMSNTNNTENAAKRS